VRGAPTALVIAIATPPYDYFRSRIGKMLLGTTKVSSSSWPSLVSTAENQRLKVSALTCGLSAADNFSQRALQLSSYNLLTPKSAFLREAALRRALIKVLKI